jgi:hypothetical protein
MFNRRFVLSRALPVGLVVLVLGCASVAQADATRPLPTGPVGTFSQPGYGSPTAVAVAGHHAYLTNSCGPGCYGPLDVIDVSVPTRPTLVGTTPLSWGTVGIAVQGRYAYTTGYHANPNFLRMIDVSNPARPFTEAAFTIAGVHPQAVAVGGSYAYMVDYGSNLLEVIDVSDPSAAAFSNQMNTSPISLPLTGETATDAGPSDIALQGNYVYVVNGVSGTLQAIDVKDPARPTVVGETDLETGGTRGTSYLDIAVDGFYAYVADANADRLEIVDIGAPDHPSVVASVPTGRSPRAIAVRDGRAYVTNTTSDTLQVIDVSSPIHPMSLGTIPTGVGPVAVAVAGPDVLVANTTDRSLQIFDMNAVGTTPSSAGSPAPPSPPVRAKGSFSLLSSATPAVTRAGSVRFRVGCVGAGLCAGRAALTAIGTHGRRVSLGATARFAVAKNRSRIVTVHLNRTTRRRVRHARHGLRARLALVGTIAGQQSSTRRSIRLR